MVAVALAARTHAHTHARTHTHTCTHAHTHTHTQAHAHRASPAHAHLAARAGGVQGVVAQLRHALQPHVDAGQRQAHGAHHGVVKGVPKGGQSTVKVWSNMRVHVQAKAGSWGCRHNMLGAEAVRQAVQRCSGSSNSLADGGATRLCQAVALHDTEDTCKCASVQVCKGVARMHAVHLWMEASASPLHSTTA
jgi:hypothetical protein